MFLSVPWEKTDHNKIHIKPPKVQHFPSNIVITLPSIFHLSLFCEKFISLFFKEQGGKEECNTYALARPCPKMHGDSQL